MKKKLFLLGLSLFTYGITSAQCETISSIDENFDEWTTIDSCWKIHAGASMVYVNNNKAISFYSMNTANANLYLVTPKINSGEYKLTFSTGISGNSDGITLTIGELSDASLTSTFSELSNAVSLTGTGEQEFSITLSEDAFIGIKVNVPSPHGAAAVDNFVLEPVASSSVSEITKNQFKVYPNPAESVVNIQSDFDITSIEIIDLTGRKVLNFNSNTADVSSLNKGTYILNIQTEKGMQQTKFIKN